MDNIELDRLQDKLDEIRLKGEKACRSEDIIEREQGRGLTMAVRWIETWTDRELGKL